MNEASGTQKRLGRQKVDMVGGSGQARMSSFLSWEFWSQTPPAGSSRVSELCVERRQDHLWAFQGAPTRSMVWSLMREKRPSYRPAEVSPTNIFEKQKLRPRELAATLYFCIVQGF